MDFRILNQETSLETSEQLTWAAKENLASARFRRVIKDNSIFDLNDQLICSLTQ